MWLFILKSSACLFLFMLFYRVFLEKESFHKFKRFYLLLAFAFSLIIPLVTFTTYVEFVPNSNNLGEVTSLNSIAESSNYWTQFLWTIYTVGLLLFASKFSINLIKIFNRIKNNTKHREQNFILVLLTEIVVPHTFLNYIFYSKSKFIAHQIPKEVILHEQTHAKQKHSLDILFLELVQIVLWFNPLIYLLKKDIKLNHEFLADQGVLKTNIDASKYQNILLAFSSNARHPQLANAINYSLIKKRFTVMKTQTTTKMVWLKSLMILPLVAFTLYGFSSRTIIEIIPENDTMAIPISLEVEQSEYQKEATAKEVAEYNKLAKKVSATLKKENIRLKSSEVERLKFLYNKMSNAQRNLAESFPDFPEPPPAPDAPLAEEPVLPPPPPPLPDNATNEQKEKYKNTIKLYKEKAAKADKAKRKAYKLRELQKSKKIKEGDRSQLIKAKQKYAAERAVLAEAKNVRAVEVEKLSEERKAVIAEAKNVRAVEVEKLSEERKAVIAEVKLKRIKEIEDIKEERQSVIKERKKVLEQERRLRVKELKGELTEIEVEEIPSSPINPLNHAIEMSKKGAKFYLEGKEISSDIAIETIKSNKKISIETAGLDSNQPKVYIKVGPAVIKD